jgi:hypothetical protein
MAEFIRGTSKQIYFMERELKSGGMATITKENGKMVNQMVLEVVFTHMVINTLDVG